MINGNDKYALEWICSTPYWAKQITEKYNTYCNYNAKWLIFKESNCIILGNDFYKCVKCAGEDSMLKLDE